MKKFPFILILIFCLFASSKIYSQNVFENKTNAKNIINNIPRFKSTSCTFIQIKKMPNIAPIKSSGNFQFIENKGVIFETTYPIKSVTNYTNEQNKKINDVILSISKGNYKFLDNNFDIYFINSNNWTLALKPNNNVAKQLNNIIIKGNQKYLEQISFNTKNGQTDIYFECEK